MESDEGEVIKITEGKKEKRVAPKIHDVWKTDTYKRGRGTLVRGRKMHRSVILKPSPTSSHNLALTPRNLLTSDSLYYVSN